MKALVINCSPVCTGAIAEITKQMYSPENKRLWISARIFKSSGMVRKEV